MPWTTEQKIFIVEAYFWQKWFCDEIDVVPDFLDNVWFLDKAHFLLSGHMNIRTTSSGVAHPQSTVCKGHYTL